MNFKVNRIWQGLSIPNGIQTTDGRLLQFKGMRHSLCLTYANILPQHICNDGKAIISTSEGETTLSIMQATIHLLHNSGESQLTISKK